MGKQRLPGTGTRSKGGRRSAAVPAVRSMTDLDPVAPATTPGAGEPESPADEPGEEITRTIKAAYQ
jgi:hypothetical protein